MSGLVILVFVVVLVCGYAIVLYNGLVRARNEVKLAWANIDVLLVQRHDEVRAEAHGQEHTNRRGEIGPHRQVLLGCLRHRCRRNDALGAELTNNFGREVGRKFLSRQVADPLGVEPQAMEQRPRLLVLQQ